jgi:hypothetical protein
LRPMICLFKCASALSSDMAGTHQGQSPLYHIPLSCLWRSRPCRQ